MRKLGIPAVVQKLTPIFEPTFSEYSYGFRSDKRYWYVIYRTLKLVSQGSEWIVELEKCFDNVAKDSDVTAQIHKSLRAGVMANGHSEEKKPGTPVVGKTFAFAEQPTSN